MRISGAWHFVAPKEGMLVFDQAAGHQLVFPVNLDTRGRSSCANRRRCD
ncbi:MAG: hypothetical protein HC788_05435 [Sphingopyxis sp.]|nr:hypothetical protein [Sphingopyxis sp.]